MISILFKTNCLTETFIERALQRAREVDDYFKTHGTVIGPLHGLPISLKDQFCLKGLETIMGAQNISCSRSPSLLRSTTISVGYAGWIGRVSDSDSVLVEILYECGAVPFVRTNVPQTLQVSAPLFSRLDKCMERYVYLQCHTKTTRLLATESISKSRTADAAYSVSDATTTCCQYHSGVKHTITFLDVRPIHTTAT